MKTVLQVNFHSGMPQSTLTQLTGTIIVSRKDSALDDNNNKVWNQQEKCCSCLVIQKPMQSENLRPFFKTECSSCESALSVPQQEDKPIKTTGASRPQDKIGLLSFEVTVWTWSYCLYVTPPQGMRCFVQYCAY